MEFEVGIVCGRCESYSVLGTATCPSCSNTLALAPAPAGDPEVSVASEKAPPTTREPAKVKPESQDPVPLPPLVESERIHTPSQTPSIHPTKSSSKPKSVEELMDQAKNFVCRSCSTPVPLGHKFCGRCGAAVPPEILNARTQFFGQLQAPGKAKLILIRGEGVEGLSYQLNAENHVVGKAGELVFPDDPFVSTKQRGMPKHLSMGPAPAMCRQSSPGLPWPTAARRNLEVVRRPSSTSSVLDRFVADRLWSPS